MYLDRTELKAEFVPCIIIFSNGFFKFVFSQWKALPIYIKPYLNINEHNQTHIPTHIKLYSNKADYRRHIMG